MAVMSKTRWFAAPDVPTITEAGGPALHISFWHAFWVPKGTPKDVVARLNSAVVTALADPNVRKRMTEQGTRFPARATDATGTRRPPQGRDRQVVANHQGGEHQGGLTHCPQGPTSLRCKENNSAGSEALRRTFAISVAAVALVAVAAGSSIATAQNYPARPVTMIVPFPPGGATDAIARILNERFRAALGQTVIIENIGGAGGSIGTHRVVRAAPDGYTLNLGQLGSHVMNGAALTLPYDLLTDLDPVSMVAANPQVIAARSGFPANNLKELIAWLKANPDKASVATVGAGSPSHVSAVYFANATGTRLNLVPYRGGGPAMQDLVANQVDLMIVQVAEAVAQAQAGRLKIFAVTAVAAQGRARGADRRRGRHARHVHLVLARAVDAARRAEGHPRQGQRRDGGDARRSDRARAARQHASGHSATRTADPRGPRGVSEIRDREVVADHQGGRHQGAVTRARDQR